MLFYKVTIVILCAILGREDISFLIKQSFRRYIHTYYLSNNHYNIHKLQLAFKYKTFKPWNDTTT